MLRSCFRRFGFLPGACVFAALWLATTAGASPHAEGPANRLANEASPYLQLHAHNPVDWYPWGDEAFARARAEDKPIFLSVGYSTCFWCHVMEREVFSNREIAAVMNEHFINIKVDREERPDIDEIYMMATQLLTGSGGWPNSVFLTPQGEPFFAGTYFPPEDQGRRPGFPRVLARLSDAWENRREDVLQAAARARAQIETQTAAPPSSNTSFDPKQLLIRAADQLEQSYESEHGGFSERTKFPNPTKLELLLTAHQAGANAQALEIVTHTLDEMALGGIYDHLGGGFHRYSTERTWSIPHYEKMLYDNAQLLGLYARAFEITGRPLYMQVTLDIANYLEREMRHAEGGFYAAQDAEVDGHEGKSYLWTRQEIESLLGPTRAADFLSVYQLAPMQEGDGDALRVSLPIEPALEHHQAKSDAELLARFAKDRGVLLKARQQRKQPLRDDKVLAAWNGLTIRGLVEAARATKRPDFLKLAESAANFVLERLLDEDGALHRSYISGQVREQAVLDDYAYLADALLALHSATGNPRWLAAARGLADRMIRDFEDTTSGGFYLTSGSPDLFARPRRIADDVEPSGPGVALRVLLTLADRTTEARYSQAAQRTIAAFGGAFERSPAEVGTAVAAVADAAAQPVTAGLAEKHPTQSLALLRSEDHVRIGARRAAGDGSLVVSVTIDPGWHINANPASLPFLVATAVEIEGSDQRLAIEYPEGTPFAPSFSPEAISTYQGAIEIPLEFGPSGRDAATGIAVRYQACDETRCLPPATSRIDLP
jgi:uncharacterized protein YyaL (SSP411 family)